MNPRVEVPISGSTTTAKVGSQPVGGEDISKNYWLRKQESNFQPFGGRRRKGGSSTSAAPSLNDFSSLVS
jgi:hypothetical protein